MGKEVPGQRDVHSRARKILKPREYPPTIVTLPLNSHDGHGRPGVVFLVRVYHKNPVQHYGILS